MEVNVIVPAIKIINKCNFAMYWYKLAIMISCPDLIVLLGWYFANTATFEIVIMCIVWHNKYKPL